MSGRTIRPIIRMSIKIYIKDTILITLPKYNILGARQPGSFFGFVESIEIVVVAKEAGDHIPDI